VITVRAANVSLGATNLWQLWERQLPAPMAVGSGLGIIIVNPF